MVEEVAAVDLKTVVEAWLTELNRGLEQGDFARAARLFAADSSWRDVLALNWDIRNAQAPRAIEAMLSQFAQASGLRNIQIDGDAKPGFLAGFGASVEAFISFETEAATGRGYLRLVPSREDGEYRAITILTSVQELKGFPESSLRKRRREALPKVERGIRNWLDERILDRSYQDREPQVLIVGAGHAGLMTAARLRHLNVDTLVVDRHERVGDNWRKRYHSLTLHNEICTNHFPYLPFPESWPVFIPKDKLANWMEFYAESMELNVWTSTTFLDGNYDEQTQRWTVRLQLADGSIRTMRPSHVVMAIGVAGTPNIPQFKGQDGFGGPILHSGRYDDRVDVSGKSVLVVGAGTSAHDIAQDAYLRGASVTMLQRSSVTVVSLEQSTRAYELFRRNEGVQPVEDTDLIVASIPYSLLARLHKPLSKSMAEADRELLEGLAKVGFKLDNGEDDSGFFMKIPRYHGGYYIDVGASQLIIDGKIKLKSGVEIERLEENRVVFSDGTDLKADLIVLATGYRPPQSVVAQLFGDAVAERVGPIWGLSEGNEIRNMWGRTAQPGLYISGGTFTMCRYYSRVTALLIKAELEGLIER